MTDVTTPTWTLGDRLRKARTEAGITNQDMADVLGVERNTISRWENDRGRVTRAVVIAYARVANVPVWWLEGKPKPAKGSTTTIWYREKPQVKCIASTFLVLAAAIGEAPVGIPEPVPAGVDLKAAA